MNRNTIKKIIASGLIIVTTVVFAEINNNGLKMPGNITFNSIVETEEISTGNTEAVKEDKSKALPEEIPAFSLCIKDTGCKLKQTLQIHPYIYGCIFFIQKKTLFLHSIILLSKQKK